VGSKVSEILPVSCDELSCFDSIVDPPDSAVSLPTPTGALLKKDSPAIIRSMSKLTQKPLSMLISDNNPATIANNLEPRHVDIAFKSINHTGSFEDLSTKDIRTSDIVVSSLVPSQTSNAYPNNECPEVEECYVIDIYYACSKCKAMFSDG